MPHVDLRKVEDGRHASYALHSHTQWSLGAITSGKSTFRYRNDDFLVNAGDLVMMNPEWVHACNPMDDQPWAYLMMYVDTQWLTDMRFKAGLLPAPHWQDLTTAVLSDSIWYDRYCHLASRLLDCQCDLLDKQTGLVEFLSDLMHELTNRPVKSQSQATGILTELASYLDRHTAEEISLDALCDLSGYSAGHLIHAFKQVFGLTPHAYQVNRRVQLGQSKLRKGASIAEAALNAGFADQPHFQRAFKRLMAATPNQYRLGSSNQQIHTTYEKQ